MDASIDSDGDEIVRLEELPTFVDAKQAERFAKQDANSDGQLTEDEVNACIWSKISAADTDSDGGVLLTELKTYWAEVSDS